MSHYDKNYFEWQKKIGEIGGKLNLFKFKNYINKEDTVLDFGCGGGYLINNVQCKEKKGFEINKSAHEECRKKNIFITDNFDELEDQSLDKIISNHAFEHVPTPFETLKKLYNKLKKGGKIIIVVPCEQNHEPGFSYKPNDINQHLYTWCPMTLGNLVKLSGFEVEKAEHIQHQWCTDFKENWNKPNFHQRCQQQARKHKNFQVRVVGIKK